MRQRSKTVLKVIAGFALVLATIFLLAGPRIGQWLYTDGIRLEARLSGLHAETVNVGDTTFVINRNKHVEGAETMVLLHGYSSNRHTWNRMATHLRKDYNIIAPDLAGHGESPYVEGLGYGGRKQAARVVAMLDELGLDKVHIAGNSMGGFISAHFAIDYPERTLSLTLIDAAGVLAPTPSELDVMAEDGINPFEISGRDTFRQFYDMTMAKPPWLPNFILKGVARDFRERKGSLDAMKNDFFRVDWLDDRLHEIQAPTLIIWGEKDRLTDVSAVQVWEDGIASSETKVFSDIGHMPQFETPKETAEVMRTFVSKYDR